MTEAAEPGFEPGSSESGYPILQPYSSRVWHVVQMSFPTPYTLPWEKEEPSNSPGHSELYRDMRD